MLKYIVLIITIKKRKALKFTDLSRREDRSRNSPGSFASVMDASVHPEAGLPSSKFRIRLWYWRRGQSTEQWASFCLTSTVGKILLSYLLRVYYIWSTNRSPVTNRCLSVYAGNPTPWAGGSPGVFPGSGLIGHRAGTSALPASPTDYTQGWGKLGIKGLEFTKSRESFWVLAWAGFLVLFDCVSCGWDHISTSISLKILFLNWKDNKIP